MEEKINDIDRRLPVIESTMATKNDVGILDRRLSVVEATMVTKSDFHQLEEKLVQKLQRNIWWTTLPLALLLLFLKFL